MPVQRIPRFVLPWNHPRQPNEVDEDWRSIVAWINSLHVVPVGGIIYFGSANPPDGYLPCNGATYPRKAYENLYNVIGVTYGAPTASTFQVPNIANLASGGATTVKPMIKW